MKKYKLHEPEFPFGRLVNRQDRQSDEGELQMAKWSLRNLIRPDEGRTNRIKTHLLILYTPQKMFLKPKQRLVHHPLVKKLLTCFLTGLDLTSRTKPCTPA